MRVSKRADYALRVLFHLADEYERKPVPLSALCSRNEVPRKFLEQIMLDLRRQGWVASAPGRYGGYVLAKSPNEITLGEVVRFFDGVVAPIGCVSTTRYEPCSQAPSCRFRRVFLEIRNQTAKIMDGATLAKVSAGAPVNRMEVFDLALIAGDGI